MRPYPQPAAWQRSPSARERRARQLLLCESGIHAALTSTGCGLFQRRCSCCGRLFEMEPERPKLYGDSAAAPARNAG